MLWVALWGGGGIVRWNPATGAFLQRLELPVPNVTCCAFGGESLEEMYITTARLGMDTDVYPLAGGLFKIRLGVQGLPSYSFAG
jgi:sugar lactone lactonase YvrE